MDPWDRRRRSGRCCQWTWSRKIDWSCPDKGRSQIDRHNRLCADKETHGKKAARVDDESRPRAQRRAVGDSGNFQLSGVLVRTVQIHAALPRPRCLCSHMLLPMLLCQRAKGSDSVGDDMKVGDCLQCLGFGAEQRRPGQMMRCKRQGKRVMSPCTKTTASYRYHIVQTSPR